MGDLRASVARAIIRSCSCELLDWLSPPTHPLEVGEYGVSVVLSSTFVFSFLHTHVQLVREPTWEAVSMVTLYSESSGVGARSRDMDSVTNFLALCILT